MKIRTKAEGRRTQKLRTRLLRSYIMIIMIPFLIVGTTACYASFQVIAHQSELFSKALLSRITSEMDNYIEKIERLSYTLYTDQQVQDVLSESSATSFSQQQMDKDYIKQKLIAIWVAEPRIIGSYLCAADGRMFYTNINEYQPVEGMEAFQAEDWYEDILQGSRLSVLTDLYRSSRYTEWSSQNLFSYIHAVKSISTGKPLGFLVIDLSISVFNDLMTQYSQGTDDRIRLFDQKGAVLFDSAGEQAETAQAQEARSVRWNKQSGKTGWTVQIQISYSSFFSNIYQIGFITALVAAACLLLFIPISNWVAGSISAPVTALQEAMACIDRGELDVEVPIRREDEVGQLSRSFNNMAVNLRHMIDQVYRSRLEKQQAEFSALQSQINPHFMYNTLEKANMMALIAGNYAVSDILTAFGNILRANLSRKENVVPLSRELFYVKNYLLIMKIGNENQYDFKIRASAQAGKCLLPKLTLQPLVENSILHGLEGINRLGIITITAKISNGQLLIDVHDNGRGLDEATQEKMTAAIQSPRALEQDQSIGISNVAHRCQLFFEGQTRLWVESKTDGEKSGTTFHLQMPVRLDHVTGKADADV